MVDVLIKYINSQMTKLFYGNYLLISWFIANRTKIFELSPEITGNVGLLEKLKEKKTFVVTGKKRVYDEYTNSIKEISRKITDLDNELGNIDFDFSTKVILFSILRIIILITAYNNYFWLTISFMSFQFFFLPFSLTSSLCRGYEIFSCLYISNTLVFPLLCIIVEYLFAHLPSSFEFLSILNFQFEITTFSVVIFFIFDYILNFTFLFFTPKGKSVKFTFGRLCQSLVLGTISKISFVVLLLLIRGMKINVTAWLIDTCLGLTESIGKKLYPFWSPTFYHVHRTAHLPCIYFDAHKFHHYLHDTLPFDSNFYGSGSPEEFFINIYEIFPAYFLGIMPPFLSYWLLSNTVDSRKEHTRKELSYENVVENFHADHHFYHTKNFGFYVGLEMFFKTMKNNEINILKDGFIIKRIERDEFIDLVYEYKK